MRVPLAGCMAWMCWSWWVLRGSVSPHVAQQLPGRCWRSGCFIGVDRSTTALDDRTNDRNQPMASGVENDGHWRRWKMNLLQALWTDGRCLPVMAMLAADSARHLIPPASQFFAIMVPFPFYRLSTACSTTKHKSFPATFDRVPPPPPTTTTWKRNDCVVFRWASPPTEPDNGENWTKLNVALGGLLKTTTLDDVLRTPNCNFLIFFAHHNEHMWRNQSICHITWSSNTQAYVESSDN